MRYAPLATVAILASATTASALNITFDYSYDYSGFFADPARRALMNQAAQTFTPFTDTLSEMKAQQSTYNPSYRLTWSQSFLNPATGQQVNVVDPTVPANTLVIYVGGRVLSGNTLGQGGPGGWSSGGYYGVPGDQAWATSIQTRNETGVNPSGTNDTDFAPWGGSIVFDSDSSWFFGSTTQGIQGSQADFLSVAIHELGHVLGHGTADSWTNKSSSGSFTGTSSVSLYGGPVPLDSIRAHFGEGAKSQLPGGGSLVETAMDPSIMMGTRKLFTALDYASFRDIGWEVPASLTAVPEPSVLLLGSGVLVAGLSRRQRKVA